MTVSDELTDDRYDEIIDKARASFRRHMGSVRGQTITPSDDMLWHVAQVAWDAALAKREAVAVAVPSAHEMLLAIAADAYRSWNEDRDMRVGKILKALASPAFAIAYRKDIAELHDLLAASQQAAKEGQ